MKASVIDLRKLQPSPEFVHCSSTLWCRPYQVSNSRNIDVSASSAPGNCDGTSKVVITANKGIKMDIVKDLEAADVYLSGIN